MSSNHRIRWKGRTEGPFTREEIKARLASGELSRLHRIEVSGNWIGLGEFLAGSESAGAPAGSPEKTVDAPAAAPAKAKRTVHIPVPAAAKALSHADAATLRSMAYFLCGLAFVAPVAATIPAVSHACRVRRYGDNASARIILALAALLTVLGFGFWYAVYTAYVRGLI